MNCYWIYPFAIIHKYIFFKYKICNFLFLPPDKF